MSTIFYRWLWQCWGLIRNKAHDLEHDCPCCGLDLPWPRSANLLPEKVAAVEHTDGSITYQIEGTRTCPRCDHQWHACVITSGAEEVTNITCCEHPSPAPVAKPPQKRLDSILTIRCAD